MWLASARTSPPPAPRVLVDVVDRPAREGAFPGVYTDTLPASCWATVGDASFVVFDTVWGSVQTICAVDVHTGSLHHLTPTGRASGGRCSQAFPRNLIGLAKVF